MFILSDPIENEEPELLEGDEADGCCLGGGMFLGSSGTSFPISVGSCCQLAIRPMNTPAPSIRPSNTAPVISIHSLLLHGPIRVLLVRTDSGDIRFTQNSLYNYEKTKTEWNGARQFS